MLALKCAYIAGISSLSILVAGPGVCCRLEVVYMLETSRRVVSHVVEQFVRDGLSGA